MTAVGSGTEALARLETTAFDIVLCDLDLGRGPNGLDVLSRMPAENQGTPFVILTSHSSVGSYREASILGATDFLEKPISRTLLLATLDHAVADGAELPIGENRTIRQVARNPPTAKRGLSPSVKTGDSANDAPRKSNPTRRDLHFRLSAAEHAALREVAGRSAESIATLLRKAVRELLRREE